MLRVFIEDPGTRVLAVRSDLLDINTDVPYQVIEVATFDVSNNIAELVDGSWVFSQTPEPVPEE